MKLKDIVAGYEFQVLAGSLDREITNISNDSRDIYAGGLFVAEEGYRVDGHDFIDAALEKGALALIVERDIELPKGETTVIRVENSYDALAYSLAQLNDYPWKKLRTIGITGTNGKTSISYILKSILEIDSKVGIIGTMGSVIDGEEIKVENTTPNAKVLNDLFLKMLDRQVDYSIMEVSSHALALKRVAYMEYETGIFTNLSKDHLDYHETIENYFVSKSKLFDMTTKNNIINIDDKYGIRLFEELSEKSSIPLVTYGLNPRADVFASDISYSLDSVSYRLNIAGKSQLIRLNIPGEFSVYNSLAAAAAAHSYGIDMGTIKKGLEAIEGVKGRFEVVPLEEDYSVIIDFAHTPEGLKQVLSVIGEFCQARIITVFGAGGNRDRTKRPEMGQVVGSLSDIAIVTSDNPRDEDPAAIIEDVSRGCEEAGANYIKIIDRIDAIKYALDIAEEGDIILLAGKGHETYTLIKGETIPCDERQIVLDYLNK